MMRRRIDAGIVLVIAACDSDRAVPAPPRPLVITNEAPSMNRDSALGRAREPAPVLVFLRSDGPLLARAQTWRDVSRGLLFTPRGPAPPSWGDATGEALGEIVANGELSPAPALLLSPPSLGAGVLVDAIERTGGGMIGVAHATAGLQPLAIDFSRDRPRDWLPSQRIELRLTSLEAIVAATAPNAGEQTAQVFELDARHVEEALQSVRKLAQLDDAVPVRIVVDESVTAQRLVDVLVAVMASELVIELRRVRVDEATSGSGRSGASQ